MGTAIKLETPVNLYDQDFYVWTMEQADLLRRRKPDWMDWNNVAEELESMGKRDRREIISRLEKLLVRIAKWQWQPEKRSQSWSQTIKEQRKQIALILKDSPSLDNFLRYSLPETWTSATDEAAEETGLPLSTFPDTCPWNINAQILADWWPE
ncbi:DUF29 domain-containing protein [Acidithiobacillus ferridurans]|uniref:DUF29 domain-containing protein n=1 Tax=Acidithiobacillus ferridurans TaxID=1232575 RepID=UPI000DE1E772|nr:DUF29 domain-containing protein [Acidithiobacillus ferridurans]MBU2823779.1 DUF29 domain-containing protein [Acidithiobacillus ferrooxidans]MCL5051747.1 DUF29 domain-containing protein [Gammaproteobacteria bacterium]MBU2720822.1 DUF29 domain-containing protein [Acidithiobacillus ferridurans]MBU2805519.1 DUF29 domain-containing protein [Acidithiobacillus ferridurans]RBL99898.1 DUF29 domain-containing protein [Acidithiobacillus ferridurans]